jgi:hypothetical protein
MYIQNANALRDARQTIDTFEKTYELTSEEMLHCEEGDERLAQIDGFDLMDWHYALEQMKVLSPFVGNLFAFATPSQPCSGFQYARTQSGKLSNSPEPELQLVA